MKYDLKERRKRLKISCADIAREFGGSRQAWSFHDRKGTYPEEVKLWMDKKEQEKEGESFSVKTMMKKFLSMGKDHELRIKELEMKYEQED